MSNFTRWDLHEIQRDSGDQIVRDLAWEVEMLRSRLAYTAQVIAAQTFDVKSLAKCRREALERTVRNCEALALGRWPALEDDRHGDTGSRSALDRLERQNGENLV